MKKILTLLVLSLIIITGAVSVSADEYLTEGFFGYAIADNKATIIGFASDAKEAEYEALCGGILTIPSRIGGCEVTQIGNEAFRYTRFLTEVKLPASVKIIGEKAFWECHSLKKINLESVEILGATSFNSCYDLENVNLKNMKVINTGAFSYSGLTEVVLPDDIEVIGSGSFGGSKIREIVIPEGKTVGEGAFSNCEKLEKILIGDNCIIETRAFEHTIGTKTVDIGKNCVIGEYVFQGCSAETVTIGDGAVISASAFNGCGMKEIDLGTPVSLGEGAFSDCTNLKEATIPGSVEVIPEDCFARCSNLEKITLEEGVKSIESFAFVDTKLKEAYLPSTLEPFNLWAIYSEWVFYSGTLTQWNELGWPYGDENVIVNWRPIDPSYIPESVNEITIIGKGSAYGRFLIKKVNNTPAKNMEVEYSINGNTPKKLVTDENGIAYVTIENIEESCDYEIMFTGTPIQTTKGVMKVTVEPLRFKSEYEAVLTRGLNVGLGFGVEGSIGELEAEAQLAEVGISASMENSISLEQEYDGDKVSLAITSKKGIEFANQAKAGLFAGLNLSSVDGVEISAGEVSGEGERGQSISVGYVDSDFDINDENDIEKMSRVVAAALLENYSHNLAVRYVMDKLDAPVNVIQKGSAVSLGAGASLGVFEFGSEDSDLSGDVTLAAKKGRLVSENSTSTLPDGSIEYKSRTATESGISFGEVNFKVKKDKASREAGFDMFGGMAKNAISVSAKRGSAGYLNKLSFATEEVEDDSIFIFDDATTNKYSITYEDAAARAVANDYSILHNFTNGAKGHFSEDEVKKVSNTMVYSGEKGTYSVKKEKKRGIDLGFSFSAALVLKIGASFGLSGVERYEFEEYSGVYENNSAYIQAYNDIEEEVKSKLITAEDAMRFVEDKISIILDEYWEVAKECVDDAKDTVVEVGSAVIKKTKDTVSGLYVSITSPEDDGRSVPVMALDYDDCNEENYYGTTLGKPYLIDVETENGEIVSDFSSNPLKLSISYTEDMLMENNAYSEALCILFWDEKTMSYVNVGGDVDEENYEVSLEIIKPGQYVLGFDCYPPQFSETSVKVNGNSGIIEANIKDFGSVEEICLYIGEEEIINKDNFKSYYDASTGKFRYESDEFEKDCGYDFTVVAKDAFGNEEYFSDYIYIESRMWQIKEVTQLGEAICQGKEFCVVLDDEFCQVEASHSVYVTVEVTDIYNNTYIKSFFCDYEDPAIFKATLPVVNSGSTVTVWATIRDRMGNSEETEKQTVRVFDGAQNEDAIVISNVSENGVTVVYYGNRDLGDCKIVLATYTDNGVLESIDILPAESSVTFERKAYNGTYKAYLWNGKGPVCENTFNAKYDTLF